MSSTAELVAFGIFISYFLLILVIFGIIGQNVPILGSGRTARQRLFSGLTIISFTHTWYYMVEYLLWSFKTYQISSGTEGLPFLRQVSGWLMNTELFEQAWSIVSTDPLPWWVSEPICLYTVGAWTIFLATNGRKYAVKHLWAYMVLGQLVAISVASNLFFLALMLAPQRRVHSPISTTFAPPTLWITVLVSLLTIGVSPYTTEQTFLPNLLVMHFLIILPLLPFGYNSRSRFSIKIKTLYLLAALIAVVLRLRTTFVAFNSLDESSQSLGGFITAAWTTLHIHPAQSSIGWDVVWTTVSFLLWVALAPASSANATSVKDKSSSSASLMAACTTSLLCSAGVAAPIAFRSSVVETHAADDKDP